MQNNYQIIEKDVSRLHREFRKTLNKFPNDRDEIILVGNPCEFLEDIPQKETRVFQKTLPNDFLGDRTYLND